MAALSVKDTIVKRWSLHRNQKQVGFNHAKIFSGRYYWWSGKQSTFPTVAKLVRKYLAVRASSAVSERLFSRGNTTTKNRSRLIKWRDGSRYHFSARSSNVQDVVTW